MDQRTTSISAAVSFSDERIDSIRKILRTQLGTRSDICVVAVGSYARREASEHSDLDYYVLVRAGRLPPRQQQKLCRLVAQAGASLGIRSPAIGGAFAECISEEELIKNIGGPRDENKEITRRVLFLLESEWLFNRRGYEASFRRLIKAYVRDTITEHQICRFLLNDVIRYYRTIGVNFEHKTMVGGKPWGDRNIKLLFSRKLMYFAGILAIAETAQQTPQAKRAILFTLLRISPIARIQAICGTAASFGVLNRYDSFLARLSTGKYRKLLVETRENRKGHTEEFRIFKNDGHNFSLQLSLLMSQTYDVAHPIHHALTF